MQIDEVQKKPVKIDNLRAFYETELARATRELDALRKKMDDFDQSRVITLQKQEKKAEYNYVYRVGKMYVDSLAKKIKQLTHTA